jgi:hypothetical protein
MFHVEQFGNVSKRCKSVRTSLFVFLPCENNLASGYLVAVFEQFLEPAPHVPATQPTAQRSERQGILHVVLENAGRWAVGFERMRVLPVRKWPRNLDIGKVASYFIVLVFGDPEAAKRPAAELDHDSRSAFDASGFFDYFHLLSGRRETFQRMWQGMPRVRRGGRSIDPRPANKNLRFHSSPPQKIAAPLSVTAKIQASTAENLYNVPLHQCVLAEHQISQRAQSRARALLSRAAISFEYSGCGLRLEPA